MNKRGIIYMPYFKNFNVFSGLATLKKQFFEAVEKISPKNVASKLEAGGKGTNFFCGFPQ